MISESFRSFLLWLRKTPGLCHTKTIHKRLAMKIQEAGPGCRYITSTWTATATAKHMGLSKKLSEIVYIPTFVIFCYKEKDVPNSKPLVFEALLQVCLTVPYTRKTQNLLVDRNFPNQIGHANWGNLFLDKAKYNFLGFHPIVYPMILGFIPLLSGWSCPIMSHYC